MQTVNHKRIWLVAIIFILLIIVLVDGVQIFIEHQNAQDVADISALAAARAKIRGDAYIESALREAANYGFEDDGSVNTIVVSAPPTFGDYAGADGLIQVVIKHKIITKVTRLNYVDTVVSLASFPAFQPCKVHPENPKCEPHIQMDGGGEVFPPEGVSRNEFIATDSFLKETAKASLAFNKPESVNLNETITVELLINPLISTDDLSKQILESGKISTATIEVTPRMEAYLYSNDDFSLIVKPLQESPEQLVGETFTSRWSWSIKALQGGTHTLTLKVFQLVKYDEKEYWQEVEAYNSDIQVNVSFSQRIQTLDWKWVLPTIATALLIPAFWRWYDSKKKRDNVQADEKLNGKQKRPVAKKKSAPKKKI